MIHQTMGFIYCIQIYEISNQTSGLAIGNFRCVQWFSWALSLFESSTKFDGNNNYFDLFWLINIFAFDWKSEIPYQKSNIFIC